MSAGDWPSTVAAKCTLSCRLACYPGEDPRALQRRVEDAVATRGCERAGPLRRVRLRRVGGRARTSRVVQVLSEAYARVHGERPALEATTATTDARHFVRRGIPAVCFGPRAERIHGIDERVSRSSMADCARGARAVRRRLVWTTEERTMAIIDKPVATPSATDSGGLQRRALGVPDLVFFIVAASAPLTAVAGGQAATYLVTGQQGHPVPVHPAGDDPRRLRRRLRGDEPSRGRRGRLLHLRHARARSNPGRRHGVRRARVLQRDADRHLRPVRRRHRGLHVRQGRHHARLVLVVPDRRRDHRRARRHADRPQRPRARRRADPRGDRRRAVRLRDPRRPGPAGPDRAPASRPASRPSPRSAPRWSSASPRSSASSPPRSTARSARTPSARSPARPSSRSG